MAVCDISQVVRTGTYYIIVQVGTGRYVTVRTDMYQVYRIPGQMIGIRRPVSGQPLAQLQRRYNVEIPRVSLHVGRAK